MKKFEYCPVCGGHFNRMSRLLLECKECGFHYFINPKSTNAVIIYDSNGRILVVRRRFDPRKDTYDLPGGFVDIEETLEQSAAREIDEELGITLTDIVYELSDFDTYGYQDVLFHTLVMFFSAKITDDLKKKIKPADDVYDPVFIHPDEIKEEDFGFPSVYRGIVAWVKKNRSSAV